MLWITRHHLLSEVQTGMILARPVVSDDMSILLNENTVLTDSMLALLKTWQIQSLYVKEIIREGGHNISGFGSEQEAFGRNYADIVRTLKDVFEKTRYFKEVPLGQVQELADQTIESLVNATGVISHLASVRAADDYTFRHSLNVGVIAGLLAKWLKFRGKGLREIVLAGLLHDIGKTQVPLEILNKPGPLSGEEMAVIEEHPIKGYKLIEDTDLIPQSVKLCVLQHHERLDGSGYPLAIAGKEIADYARIIAVADVYDAMTSRRVYRGALTPFSVIAEIFAEMFIRLDPAVALPFISHVRDSLVGFLVRLSDGTEARVVYLDKDRPAQPVVKLAGGDYIDLEKRRDLTITEVIAS
ncbi:HD-GYP domain-containing protein [Anaeroselena agilis]|uniref:HD-GYP domain-containing protein n=1 Tax=Anaeroselena agilis TaxID=3063788 RepID=A0ABU3NUS3_9FIRM|nr:HD-GYP domain-containing protein [Selenomonadales bacterium 4137-cl]